MKFPKCLSGHFAKVIREMSSKGRRADVADVAVGQLCSSVAASNEQARVVVDVNIDRKHGAPSVQIALGPGELFRHHDASMPVVQRRVDPREKMPRFELCHWGAKRVTNLGARSLKGFSVCPPIEIRMERLEPDYPCVEVTSEVLRGQHGRARKMRCGPLLVCTARQRSTRREHQRNNHPRFMHSCPRRWDPERARPPSLLAPTGAGPAGPERI